MDETSGTPLIDEPGLPGFGAAPKQSAGQPPAPAYRVLARKYRPKDFDDLIGQGAMVRTLANAFEAGRIPQAWMLTGVRGVGKTTTARILARGLNYALPDDANAGPTIRLPKLGLHCAAIMESRHIDVLEMDAASHTGIDDVRQIIDGIRYSPVSARYKVYIVDEVHMLSEKAFNAFLKTLEEPPPHAKFVFATTEIRKVPVTILSRCQRFDLRRVEAGALIAHLQKICDAEGVSAEAEALAAIARAAEGSVRDSLSLLDQAIAHGAGHVTAETVRDMLGLADRARVVDLFEAAMRGDVPATFSELRSQHESGADPAVVLSDLAEFTHLVTRLKLAPDSARVDTSLSEVERVRGGDFADRLSVRALSRAWQILLKAIPEVQAASRPLAAAEMALVRLIYAADLPTPDEALRQIRDGGSLALPARAPGAAPASTSAMASAPVRAAAPAMQAAPAPARSPRCGPAAPRRPCAPCRRCAPSCRPRPPRPRRCRDRPWCRRRRRPSPLPPPRLLRHRRPPRHRRPNPARSCAASRTWWRSPTNAATSASRWRWSATRIWCGSRTAGSSFVSPRADGRRSPPTSPTPSMPGPAGAGWWPCRTRPARRRSTPGPRPRSRAATRVPRATRWSRRCSRASRAPRSSTSATRPPIRRSPTTSRRRIPTIRTCSRRALDAPHPVRRTSLSHREDAAMDIMGLMKQAQAMQQKMADLQSELDGVQVTGASGGGSVSVTMTAKGDVKGLTLDPALLVPDEKEILEDLIVAALNDAKAKAERAAQERMQDLTKGLPLPPGMKLPF